MNSYLKKESMISKYRVLLLWGLLLAATGMRAAGEVTFSIENFNIQPGETVEISLDMTNSVVVQVFNGAIALSEGLTFVGEYDEDEERVMYAYRTPRLHNKHEIGFSLQSPSSMTFLIQSGITRRDISGNAGAVLKFKVKADEDMAPSEATVTVTELSATNSDNVELVADDEFTTRVNVYNVITDEAGNSYITKWDDEAELTAWAADATGVITVPGEVNGRTVTSVGEQAFDNIDKSAVTAIDLTQTGVTNMTVSRTEGIFAGFSENTLIYLPAGTGNQAAEGEKNVVIGGICDELLISENDPMTIPITFNAKHAVFDRVFVPGITSTVYLPFSIPASEMVELGAFYTFKEISDEGTAVFNAAETGEIPAKVPYIFVPKDDVSGIDVADEAGGITVAVSSDTEGTNGQLIGTTTAIVWDESNPPVNIYGFAGAEKDGVTVGTFVKALVGASIAPYRAYLLIDGDDNRNSYSAVVENGESSGIEVVEQAAAKTEDSWYNLNGQRLGTAPDGKGIYVKNGQVIIIK